MIFNSIDLPKIQIGDPCEMTPFTKHLNCPTFKVDPNLRQKTIIIIMYNMQ